MPIELNFLYWLERHLKMRGFDLKQLDSKLCSERGDEKVWHWSANAAREIFSQRAYQAGYDEKFFSYHSLRAGFLCQSFIKAGSKHEAEAVLEHTALIAGWKVGGSAQLLYIKKALMSQLCSNGLVTGEQHRMLNDSHTTEVFHHIKTPVSRWR